MRPSRARSSTTTSRMACGGGKNGSGSRPSFAVTASQAAKNSASAISHGASPSHALQTGKPNPGKGRQCECNSQCSA